MYSTHNEGKSVVAERFTNKIYKHMTSISKNVYFNKLDDIVNDYNNTKYRTTKMKPTDVKDNTYIDFGKEVHIHILTLVKRLMIMILNLKSVIM